jgi:hypothetical protein
VVIRCTEPEARALSAWLSNRPEKPLEYEGVVKLIERTLRDK